MDKRSEYLHTLGLGPDATWEEVTQTYKDLMRVWHPDRFPSDERLRKKAEQESQRINQAMTELKKLGKNPPKKKSPPLTTQTKATQRKHAQTLVLKLALTTDSPMHAPLRIYLEHPLAM